MDQQPPPHSPPPPRKNILFVHHQCKINIVNLVFAGAWYLLFPCCRLLDYILKNESRMQYPRACTNLMESYEIPFLRQDSCEIIRKIPPCKPYYPANFPPGGGTVVEESFQPRGIPNRRGQQMFHHGTKMI